MSPGRRAEVTKTTAQLQCVAIPDILQETNQILFMPLIRPDFRNISVFEQFETIQPFPTTQTSGTFQIQQQSDTSANCAVAILGLLQHKRPKITGLGNGLFALITQGVTKTVSNFSLLIEFTRSSLPQLCPSGHKSADLHTDNFGDFSGSTTCSSRGRQSRNGRWPFAKRLRLTSIADTISDNLRMKTWLLAVYSA
ncbi:hypothetical protein IFR04_003532 [Cadophora malorum]|uniref:Uncharacterized protein n=1 Tax=Cadophora malorum TaxID=108018 RepID=A0A8H7WEA0_9HELO|nr:hypothetical protein IFR04_003532 [Cadophora malorum]